MVTVDPPLGVLTLPTIKDIWSAITVDRAVAITALICGTVGFCFLVWSLSRAVDAAGLATALSMVIGAAAGAFFGWVKTRKGKARD